jgi:hypothetical protein
MVVLNSTLGPAQLVALARKLEIIKREAII